MAALHTNQKMRRPYRGLDSCSRPRENLFERYLPLADADAHDHRLLLVVHADHLASGIEAGYADHVVRLQARPQFIQSHLLCRFAIDGSAATLELFLLAIGLMLRRQSFDLGLLGFLAKLL